ncbi:glutamate synthase subunit beta [Rhodanobacter fulvus Jip2]|uniref:Glutamate synthase subunit beta n=1 Tax=Rhodanobacter fulvus Jip2 TaxID=1163408 RepID=I4VL88_9GAMM|nr:glutamate synthase subunit beta [Rhodanobacter fulvus]EIL87979.1 glutamate synthase subunit beta [Rhodanobacter fulvus Jip2]
MGKITGFLEYPRQVETAEVPVQRVKHWREFTQQLTDEQAKIQGARCMDCGTPFCHHGCPVNNIIPDFNDLVYRQDWKHAIEVLHSTNNFPEFTGRICPAPCEAACTLNINSDAVGIKSIEHKIIDKAWEEGWVTPQPAAVRTGWKVAVVGSGPAGLAAAQQLARVGHAVTVFEKNDRVGGLLRYGIPDFKLEKSHIDRRVKQMSAEGVQFRTSVFVGAAADAARYGKVEAVTPEQLQAEFDAVIIAGGSETPRDLPVPGRELKGVHFAMDFLPQQNKVVAGDRLKHQMLATARKVVVIGGGDTGSDCVGTSNRQGAISVTQFELLPQPPAQENKPLVWPYWPLRLRTSTSHEEGCQRDWSVATKRFNDDGKGNVKSLTGVRLEWKDGKMGEVAGSEFEIAADLVLLAMGFVSPVQAVLDAFGVDKDARGNAKASTDGAASYRTSVDKVFAAGDMRRGQSLVVWAIREGRQCAHAVDEFLMGVSTLPR